MHLKSMEITGNKFAREAFGELGIQKISGIYDYESASLQKYKSDLAEKVQELIEMENLQNGKNSNGNGNNPTNNNDNNNTRNGKNNIKL
jgi:hypothetical protein